MAGSSHKPHVCERRRPSLQRPPSGSLRQAGLLRVRVVLGRPAAWAGNLGRSQRVGVLGWAATAFGAGIGGDRDPGLGRPAAPLGRRSFGGCCAEVDVVTDDDQLAGGGHGGQVGGEQRGVGRREAVGVGGLDVIRNRGLGGAVAVAGGRDRCQDHLKASSRGSKKGFGARQEREGEYLAVGRQGLGMRIVFGCRHWRRLESDLCCYRSRSGNGGICFANE